MLVTVTKLLDVFQVVTQTCICDNNTSLVVLVMFNIPTVIYIGIYGACRGKRKKSQELEKMNIQDLE